MGGGVQVVAVRTIAEPRRRGCKLLVDRLRLLGGNARMLLQRHAAHGQDLGHEPETLGLVFNPREHGKPGVEAAPGQLRHNRAEMLPVGLLKRHEKTRPPVHIGLLVLVHEPARLRVRQTRRSASPIPMSSWAQERG